MKALTFRRGGTILALAVALIVVAAVPSLAAVNFLVASSPIPLRPAFPTFFQ